MDKETLADVIFDIGHKENDACAPSTCKVVADYILDNFVSKDTPPSICQHEWVGQISPDRPNYFICKHCGKPKPTLPAVPEKLNGLFITDKRVVTAINSLIDCYSALKKVVEEKL